MTSTTGTSLSMSSAAALSSSAGLALSSTSSLMPSNPSSGAVVQLQFCLVLGSASSGNQSLDSWTSFAMGVMNCTQSLASFASSNASTTFIIDSIASGLHHIRGNTQRRTAHVNATGQQLCPALPPLC